MYHKRASIRPCFLCGLWVYVPDGYHLPRIGNMFANKDFWSKVFMLIKCMGVPSFWSHREFSFNCLSCLAISSIWVHLLNFGHFHLFGAFIWFFFGPCLLTISGWIFFLLPSLCLGFHLTLLAHDIVIWLIWPLFSFFQLGTHLMDSNIKGHLAWDSCNHLTRPNVGDNPWLG